MLSLSVGQANLSFLAQVLPEWEGGELLPFSDLGAGKGALELGRWVEGHTGASRPATAPSSAGCGAARVCSGPDQVSAEYLQGLQFHHLSNFVVKLQHSFGEECSP